MKVNRKPVWAFQIEHVPLIRCTEVIVSFLSPFTHIHAADLYLPFQISSARCGLVFFLSLLSLRLQEGFVRILTFFLRIVSSLHLTSINTDACELG